MEPFVLAFIAIGLLVVLVFIIYLVDRVNAIEKETRQVAKSLHDTKEPVSLDPFGGLSSKKLWDAMTGRVPEGMSPSVVAEVRERFEAVLQKHIEAIFHEAVKDAQRGLTGEPKNTKVITTLRGSVESWLPSAQVNTLYQCGVDSTQLPADQLDAVRAALDEVGQTLYSKALLTLAQPLSVNLLPRPVADVPALVPPSAP
jgi:hypothetical protein